MAEQNPSTFTEMLEVKLDLATLQTSLNEALVAWNKFKADVGGKNTGDLLKAGSFAGLKSEIADLAKALKDIEQATLDTQSQVVEMLSKSVDKQVDLEKQKNKKIVTDAEATKAKLNSLTEEVAAKRAEALEKIVTGQGPSGQLVELNKAQKLALDLRMKTDGLVNQQIEAAQKASDKAIRDNAIEAFKEVARQRLANAKAAESIDDQASRRRKEVLARDLGAQINALADLQAKNTKYEKDFTQLVREEEANRRQMRLEAKGAFADVDRQRTESAQRNKKIDDDAAARRREIASQQQGDQAALARQQVESEKQQTAFQRLKGQLDQMLNKGAQGQFKQSLLLAPDDEARFKVIREELARVRALAAQVKAEVDGIGNRTAPKTTVDDVIERVKRTRSGQSGATTQPSADSAESAAQRLELQRRLNTLKTQETQALTEHIRLQDRLAKAEAARLRSAEKVPAAQQQSTGFIREQLQAIPKTIALVVRYAAAWQAVALVTQAAGAAITAPFAAIANGLSYLRETERASDDLVGVLAANVKFTEGYAENFIIAKKSALEVTKELQVQAALTGSTAEALEGIFKGMIGAGVSRYVQDLDEAIQLTVLFQQGLSASALGALNVGNAVQKINQLFNGEVSNDDPFFKAYQLTGIEFNKILKSAEKTKDLLPQLAERSKPFRDALVEAGKGQAVLLQGFERMKERIEGIAVQQLFDKINSGLIVVNKFLIDNQDRLASYLKLLADGLVDLAEAIGRVSEAFKVLDGLTVILHAVIMMLETVKAVTISTMAAAKLLSGGLGPGGIIAPDAKAWEEFRKELDEVSDSYERMTWVISGGTIVDRNANSKLLKNKIEPNRKNNPTGANTAVLQAQLELEKAKLDRQIGDIERKYQELGDITRLALADRSMSYKDAAEQIKLATASEIKELDAVQAKKIDLIKRTAAAVAGDVGANPRAAQAASLRLQAQVMKAGEEYEDKKRALEKKANEALAAAKTEAVNIEKDSIKAYRAVRQQNANAAIALERELLEQGFSSQVESFDRISAKEDELNELRQQAQDADLQQYAKGTVEYNRLLKEKELGDIVYTDGVVIRTLKRKAVVADENAQRSEQLLRQTAIVNDLQEAELGLLQAANPTMDLSSQYERIVKARQAELEATIALREEQLRLAQSRSLESIETRNLTTELMALGVQRTQLVQQQIAAANQNISNPIYAAANARRIKKEAAAEDELRRLRAEVEGGVANFSTTKNERKSTVGRDVGRGVLNEIAGTGFIEAFKSAQGAVEKFGVGVGLVGNVMAVVTRLVGLFKQGKEEGGLLGGLGAVASQFGAVPVVGPYIQAAGQILTFVGVLFTNAAKRMAEDVKRSVQKTLDSFQKGDTTLVDTITALEAARINAIQSLSGKKGGKTELDKFLPDLEEQIDALKRQQKELIAAFENQLTSLSLQSDQLEQVRGQWQAINKQVQEYLGAGGDAGRAAEFLSLSLGKIRQQAIESLDSAEQEAIQSVLKLNELLLQRNKLVEDFAKKEFDLRTQGSVERRQAGSVLRGKELQELRSQHQEQLAQLDREIRNTQTKVDKEQEIFNLTRDTIALRRRDEELTIKALDMQIQKLKDLQTIVGSITQGNGGSFTGAGSLYQIGQVTVTVNGFNGNPADIGRQAADSFTAELNRRSRMGT
jgi:hypothetical protein